MSRTLNSRRRDRWVRGVIALGAAAAAARLAWGALGTASRFEQSGNEGCFLCHDVEREGPAGLHQAFPCELCHLGDPTGTNVLQGHRGMVVEGAALEVVDRTCGPCHEREVEWVRSSLMATGRGLIAVDRWAFGELPTPDGTETFLDLSELEEPTPAQDHLRKLCLGCHLNTRRENRDVIIGTGTGSGCSACHRGPALGGDHSSIPGVPADERCFGCHSRSSRISLTYQGLVEVSGPWAKECSADSTLADDRSVCRTLPDVHHEGGMACVDCHLYTELMGNGKEHLHQEQAVEIRCETCHGPAWPGQEALWWEVTDTVSTAILHLHLDWRQGSEAARLTSKGTPVWNLVWTRDPAGTWTDSLWAVQRKADGRLLPVPPTPMDPPHRVEGHERLACVACHARSAPTCPTCHTTFDRLGEQWDFGIGKWTAGEWVETNEGVGEARPGLAVGPDGRILPAIPGMVGALDARPAGGDLRSLHLFSVLDPHSTRKEARTCIECHTDATLYVHGEGTRIGSKALVGPGLEAVLAIGPCLECHEPQEAFWTTFRTSMERLDPRHPRELPDGGVRRRRGGDPHLIP